MLARARAGGAGQVPRGPGQDLHAEQSERLRKDLVSVDRDPEASVCSRRFLPRFPGETEGVCGLIANEKEPGNHSRLVGKDFLSDVRANQLITSGLLSCQTTVRGKEPGPQNGDLLGAGEGRLRLSLYVRLEQETGPPGVSSK